jgi:hypothetical protein
MIDDMNEIPDITESQPKRRGRKKKVIDGFEEMESVSSQENKPKTTRTRKAKGGTAVASILVPFLILIFWVMSLFTHPAFQMTDGEAKNISGPLGNIIANIPWLYEFFTRYGTNSSDYVALFFALIGYWQGAMFRMEIFNRENQTTQTAANIPNPTNFASNDNNADDEQPITTLSTIKHIGRGD